jgi:hypothetical protein
MINIRKMSNYNINSMTINNIIDFIRDKLYIDNNYTFRCNTYEYNNIGNIYIDIFKDKFNNVITINDNEVLFNYNNIIFNITIINDNNDIYWNIKINNI